MSTGVAFLPADVAAFHGVEQFCYIYHTYKNLKSDGLLWGDETEYFIVSTNDAEKSSRPLLCATDVLNRVQSATWDHSLPPFLVMPECTEYQLETIPFQPFSGRLEDLGMVEMNMNERRKILQRWLPSDAHLLTMTSFPRFGCAAIQDVDAKGQSPDWAAFDDLTLSRSRKRSRLVLDATKARAGISYGVDIQVFQDVNTEVCSGQKKSSTLSDHMTVRSWTIGHCNGLHVTLQAKCLDEARYLHDQLAVLSPVLIALSAGASAFHGFLNQDDSRLIKLSQALDDRTAEEKEGISDGNGELRHQLQRCGPVKCFVSEDGQRHNNLKLVYNVPAYDTFICKGVDRGMAMHGATLFSHPLFVMGSGEIPIPEKDTTQVFESINNTVWPYVRLKTPSVDVNLGWRIEFRPIAIQPTDFENAAFAVFVLLLSRTLRRFSPSFLIPMSKVHENCRRAVSRDAVCAMKFHFRTNVYETPPGCVECPELSIDDIVNGCPDFPGLLSLIRQFLDAELDQPDVRRKVDEYLHMISSIASGDRPTVARRIRQFVLNHAEYKKDSKVTERIQYDIVKAYIAGRM